MKLNKNKSSELLKYPHIAESTTLSGKNVSIKLPIFLVSKNSNFAVEKCATAYFSYLMRLSSALVKFGFQKIFSLEIFLEAAVNPEKMHCVIIFGNFIVKR